MPTFSRNDVIIDSDGLPWMYYDGYFKSSWSVMESSNIATMLLDHDSSKGPFDELSDRVEDFGLTYDELNVLKYGPFRKVLTTELINE